MYWPKIVSSLALTRCSTRHWLCISMLLYVYLNCDCVICRGKVVWVCLCGIDFDASVTFLSRVLEIL